MGGADTRVLVAPAIHMDVIGTEASHPYLARRAYQGQLLVPEPAVIPVPAMPQVDDPCGPGNASWAISEEDDELSWSLDSAAGEIMVAVRTDAVFEGGGTTHSFGIAVDSERACPEPTLTAATTLTAPHTTPSRAAVPAASASSPDVPTRGLVRTGIDGLLVSVVVVAVLGCGGALLYLARRRER
ncbi:hypothetical protein [Actinomyces sp.]|uniref:hypothetical protein n=1 Tax=Actinomyces sp. TaxID=29317 RepID=UPI0026DCE8AB|nr:hypothetical protein [Actinomyces sp.]MDO4901002.1 hypothetical protein [Actinomyces sp.]